MKIYTKGGDKGKTSLIGGKRVYKNDDQVDAYGTIDELISHIGMLRSMEINHDWIKRKYNFTMTDNIKQMLLDIQDRLMVCASIVATEKGKNIKMLTLSELEIILLEKWIDNMTEKLPELKSFILPGGTKISAQCHITRTVCRRAERLVIGLSSEENEMVVMYLNRLSDFLFVLARILNVEEETLWE